MRIVAPAFLVIVLLLAAVPPAGAATVSSGTRTVVWGKRAPHPVVPLIAVQAGVSEVNDVSVRDQGDGWALVRDARATLTAGDGCAQVDEYSARCPIGRVEATLGDGDDRFAASSVPAPFHGPGVVLDGGAGDDVLEAGGPSAAELVGGEGDDVLTGAALADALTGGRGRDRLAGGAGPDVLVGDGAGAGVAADVLDGGRGSDTVVYRDRRSPVTVDLARRGRQGAAGEGDVIVRVENAQGGEGSDVLAGNGAANELLGPGRSTGWAAPRVVPGDVLVGRGGDDRLLGGAGVRDRLSGGAGDDHLEGLRGTDRISAGPGDDLIQLNGYGVHPERKPGDRVRCGRGRDLVRSAAATDRLAGCERVERM